VGWDLDDNGAVQSVYIRFFDPRAGHCRKRATNAFGADAVPITAHPVTYQLASGREVTRTGFPLVHAAGITVHKSQGQTYDRHAVELLTVFTCGQAYVGISRGKSAAGTIIIGSVRRDSFYCDPEALEEMKRLRTSPRERDPRIPGPVAPPSTVADDPLLQ